MNDPNRPPGPIRLTSGRGDSGTPVHSNDAEGRWVTSFTDFGSRSSERSGILILRFCPIQRRLNRPGAPRHTRLPGRPWIALDVGRRSSSAGHRSTGKVQLYQPYAGISPRSIVISGTNRLRWSPTGPPAENGESSGHHLPQRPRFPSEIADVESGSRSQTPEIRIRPPRATAIDRITGPQRGRGQRRRPAGAFAPRPLCLSGQNLRC